MAKSNAEKQRDFVERKKTGSQPERRLTLWVPVATFDRFNSLAKAEGRSKTFTRLVEGAQP